MKKLLFIVFGILLSLNLHSQEKKGHFWGFLDYNYDIIDKKVIMMCRTSGQMISSNIVSNPDKGVEIKPSKMSAENFIEILFEYNVGPSSHCFAGDEEQAYNDLFKNVEIISYHAPMPTADGSHLNINGEQRYRVSYDVSTKQLNITLVEEQVCTGGYIPGKEGEGCLGSGTYDDDKCLKWEWIERNYSVILTRCTDWDEPLRKFMPHKLWREYF